MKKVENGERRTSNGGGARSSATADLDTSSTLANTLLAPRLSGERTEERGCASGRTGSGNIDRVRKLKTSAQRPILTYAFNKSILEKIWLERLRQKQLLREGKIFFACDSPVVSHERKLRVIMEEIGEVARALEHIEILNPLRQPRAALSEPSTRAKQNLRDELTQVASVAIAWLESLQEEKP